MSPQVFCYRCGGKGSIAGIYNGHGYAGVCQYCHGNGYTTVGGAISNLRGKRPLEHGAQAVSEEEREARRMGGQCPLCGVPIDDAGDPVLWCDRCGANYCEMHEGQECPDCAERGTYGEIGLGHQGASSVSPAVPAPPPPTARPVVAGAVASDEDRATGRFDRIYLQNLSSRRVACALHYVDLDGQ